MNFRLSIFFLLTIYFFMPLGVFGQTRVEEAPFNNYEYSRTPENIATENKIISDYKASLVKLGINEADIEKNWMTDKYYDQAKKSATRPTLSITPELNKTKLSDSEKKAYLDNIYFLSLKSNLYSLVPVNDSAGQPIPQDKIKVFSKEQHDASVEYSNKIIEVAKLSGNQNLVQGQTEYKQAIIKNDPLPGKKITKCSFSGENPIYCMLAPIGIFTTNKELGAVSIGPDGLTLFLNNLVRFAIAIATGLAVVMIVIGGVQYASTDAINGKSDGASRIKQALSGLMLAIVSYVVLETINPDVFATKLDLEKNPATGEFIVLEQPESDPTVDTVEGAAAGLPADGGSATPNATGKITDLAVQGNFNKTQQRELKDNGIEPTSRIITDAQGNQFVGGPGSIFGGPKDHDNGQGDRPLPLVPGKTAKMLDTDSYYVAFRWDYSKTTPEELRNSCVEVYIPGATKGKKYFKARPVDWGPGLTSKSVDVSPAIERDAGINLTGATIGIRIISC